MHDQDSTSHKSDWPAPLSDEAFPGLAGEIVHTLAPHSEADPAALLLQLLVAFGNIIGHQAHYLLGSTRHSANLFAVLAGASSKARKGTSWDLIRALTAVLKMLAREGNILSAVLRNAWDGVELNTLTRKHSSLHASEAHISIVGHVTVSELRRHLSQTEMGNGFANSRRPCAGHQRRTGPGGNCRLRF